MAAAAGLPAQSGFESDEDIDLDEFSPEPADSRTLGIPLAGVVAAAVLLAVALGAFIVFNIGSGDPVAQLEVPATGQSAEAGDPVAQLEVPATGQSAEAGDPDAAPAGGGAAGPPQLPPDTPVDKLMVVRVGGGSTDGDEGDLLPIHQFMVTPPHAPTIIVRFTGGDDLNVFPDQLVYTDDSYQGDPATACRDPHFHMPEFMPTGMNIEGIIIPEPNAQGCGYGRVSEAFPIQVPTTISDAWEEQAGWDPRTGEPLVELLVIMTPAVTDQAVDTKMLVTIQNVGQVPWSTIEFDDSTFGGLLGPNADLLSNDCTGPIALAPFETKKCSYGVHVDRTMSISAEVAAPKPGDLDATELREIFTTSVDISVRDEDGNIGGDSYAPLMYFSSYFAALEVEKASDPQTLEDPGPVEFTVTIRNGGTETFDLVQVVDTQYGDLLNEMNPRVTKSDCPDLPRVIEPNQEFDCSFVGEVGSNQEDGNHLNEVFVTVVNPSSEFGTASGELRIPITNPGPVDTSGLIMWDLFLAEGVIDEIPDGVGK
jgi:hypothetical protein